MEMQVTIDIPDISLYEKVFQKIKEVKESFIKEGVLFNIKQDLHENPYEDPWDSLNIDEIAVDTGIEDFSLNHDHYIYGAPKRS